MKNRFNRLTSKEWLPFQKSWFKESSDEILYRENIRFFTKAEHSPEKILYYGKSFELFRTIANENELEADLLDKNDGHSQFILIDLRGFITNETKVPEYKKIRDKIIELVKNQSANLEERRFLSVFIPIPNLLFVSSQKKFVASDANAEPLLNCIAPATPLGDVVPPPPINCTFAIL